MSRAIKPAREDNLLTGWEPAPEFAPSIVRGEQPTVARVLAMVGVFMILLGLVPVIGPLVGVQNPIVGAWTGFFSVSTGVFLTLFQAFLDRERAFRRLYSGVGLLLIAGALILAGVAGWAATGTQARIVTPAGDGIDPMQIMMSGKGLPAEHYRDFSVVFE